MKKVFIIAVLFILSHAVNAASAASNEFIWGDVDGDGAVTEHDAVLVLKRYVFSIDAFPVYPDITWPDAPPASDVNGDGVTGTVDAGLLLQYTAGEIDTLPADTDGDGWGPDTPLTGGDYMLF